MVSPSSDQVTQLLQDWSEGNQAARDELLPLVYDELRRLAGSYLRRERPGHTLQTTALVHEAYLRLINQNMGWQNRAHFFGIAAQLMRRILVDHARGQHYAKRGGDLKKFALDEALDLAQAQDSNMVALDEALTSLAAFDPQQSRIVELRFFGGLTIEETAQVLGVSESTVERGWTFARAWLLRELERK